MAQLDLSLAVISPLAMRSDHASRGNKTANLVSGSTLLGSLAATHRMFYINEPDKAEEFAELFLRGKVQYPNLYPASLAKKAGTEETVDSFTKEMQEALLPVYPVPKTAQSCKRHSGFLKEGDKDQHGVRDGLLDWALFKLSGERAVSVFVDHKRCPRCDAAMDYFKGYYRRARFISDSDGKLSDKRISTKVNTRLQTRTGINRDWDIVQEGILYNREVIEEGMCFWGTVKLPSDLVSPFKTFVEEVNSARLVRMGTGRTRGLGQVNLTVHRVEDEEQSRVKFDKRLEDFNRRLQDRLKGIEVKEPAPFYFAVTLHSPTILRDELLRYHGTIGGKTLAELTDLPTETFRQVHQIASVGRVTSWNDLWGTPRMQEYAIDTGSVFLFASSQEADDMLLSRLFKREEEGMGQRRVEGFGRVCISDPFHLEGDIA